MCITRAELEKKIEELRSLKALKEETENELKALEYEVISYMKENELTEEITNTAKLISHRVEQHLTKKSLRKYWEMI